MRGRQLCPNCCRELKATEIRRKSHWFVQTEICPNCGSEVYNTNRLKIQKYALTAFVSAVVVTAVTGIICGVKIFVLVFLILSVSMLIFDSKFVPEILKKLNSADTCQHFVLVGKNNRRFSGKALFRAEICGFSDFEQFRADNILLMYNGRKSCFVTVKSGSSYPFCEFSANSVQKAKLSEMLADSAEIFLSDGENPVGKLKVTEIYNF